MDYDHNAPDAEHLKNTHENFFKTVRRFNSKLPVVIVSKPDTEADPYFYIRRGIIERTYKNAKKSGDKHVYFVDGETLFGKNDRDTCTVDGCHPNDLGFYRMAKNIRPTLKKALGS